MKLSRSAILTALLSVFALTLGYAQGNDILYRLYLVGDAGTAEERPALSLAKSYLLKEENPAGIIFLGDNIYQNGLPPKAHKDRQYAEKAINGQIDIVRNFNGQKFFIPGNHDWRQGRANRLEWLQRQEDYVENALDSLDVFLPSDGCPGPIEIPLTKEVVLIIMDTQWFLNKGEKMDRSISCGAKNGEEAFILLRDILLRHKDKKVIMATHHPMYSKGHHGGTFTFKDHLFPLTNLNSSLYIPLPIIGSIYPLYTQLLGSSQDLSNLNYKAMVNAITALLNEHPDLVHVAGHEHALQHLKVGEVNYVVSGSASKLSHVKQKEPSLFAGNYHGFGRLTYYRDGRVELDFFSPEATEEKLYHATLSDRPFPKPPSVIPPSEVKLPNSPVNTRASTLYNSGGFRKTMFGKGYRDEWYLPIDAPVFDIGSEKGGLTIIKRGGGNQTKSLRFEAADGKQYVLRLLEKDASKVIPKQFQSSFVKKVVQEGISGSHPYAALVVPPLADVAGVYHANPRVVYVPDDPRFGIYREEFRNQLGLFEERASGDQREADYFGNSKDVENTPKVLKNLYKDNDNKIDQESVLRARLFDMWLGDWDRHDDQWRWAEFNHKGKGKTYRPIPRDRDQVFYVSEGIVPGLIGSSWAVPAMQGFNAEIKNVKGLWSFAAKYFDRSFMNELSGEEWLEIATSQQQDLTDEVILEAFRLWPDSIYDLRGKEIYEKLKSRRDDYVRYAMEYYEILAREVEIVGSNKHETFEVIRSDQQTEVTVYKRADGERKDKILYHRIFYPEETREIRIYGLDGEDEFLVLGEARKGIRIRLIGGDGEDVIRDQGNVRFGGKRTFIYDDKKANDIVLGKDSKDKTSSNPDINRYNRKEFQYNYVGPLLSFSFNPDDGVFIGAGAHITQHGWRKTPFKSDHVISGNIAVATASFFLKYQGQVTGVIGKADLVIDTEIRSPNYVTNFFGLGNDSDYNSELNIDYYRVRFRQFWLDALIRYRFGERNSLNVGPTMQTVEVENTPNRFVSDFANNGLDSATVFERKWWAGLKAELVLDSRDHKHIPQRGVYWKTDMTWYYGLSESAKNYSQFRSDLRLYYSFRMPARVTFANRIGFAQNFGDFEFYQANYLDGHDQLRGFRKYRFAGKRSFYNNAELRIKLFTTRALFVPVQFGIAGFWDVGRVWLAEDNSNTWHHAFGGGLWMSPANLISLSLIYGASVEGGYPMFNFGFFF